jgi:hypothetical protein
MKEDTVAVLRTEPAGWGSWSARINSGDHPLTELRISLFRSRGRFSLHGEEFSVDPQGLLGTTAVLRKGSNIIARAEKTSAFRRRFRITSAGHRLDLVSRSWSGREYALLLGSQEVGMVRRTGFGGRKITMEFPDQVPVFLQVFLAYLVLCQAKREAAAASGGS